MVVIDIGRGLAAHAQRVIGAHAQRGGRLHLAAEADGAACIHGHGHAADRGVGLTKRACGGGVGGDHGLQHRLGRRDGPRLPHRHVVKGDLRHLLGRRLLDRQVLVQRLVKGDELEGLLRALVVDGLPLRLPLVGVVGVVLLDRLVLLPAAPDVVDVVLRAALLARVVGVLDRPADLVVLPVARVAARAGPIAQVQAAAVDDLIERRRILGRVRIRHRPEVAAVVDRRVGQVHPIPGAGPPTPLRILRPAPDALPVVPVLVLEAELVINRAAVRELQRRGVERQRIDIGVEGLDAVGVAAELPGFHGGLDLRCRRRLDRVGDVGAAREPPVRIGVEGDQVAVADRVVPLGVACQGRRERVGARIEVIGLDAGVADVARRPGRAAVFLGRMRLDTGLVTPQCGRDLGIGIWKVILRRDLVVEDLAELLVAPDQFARRAGAHRRPRATRRLEDIVRGVERRRGLQRGGDVRAQRVVVVLLQEAGLPGRLHAQDVDVRALRHAHVAVTPAIDVDEVDVLRVVRPGRCDHLVRLDDTILGALQRRFSGLAFIAVGELEQRHVAGVLQHRRALRVVQACEVEVGGLVGVVETRRRSTRTGPVHRRVLVVKTFDQDLDEAPLGHRVRVVVADLREHHVHRRVLGADLELLVLDDLGDLGRLPGDHGHLDGPGGHLLVAHHGRDRLGHGVVALDRDRARARHHRVSIQRDIASSLDHDVAAGRGQAARAADGDRAADHFLLQDRGLEARTRPRHVDASVQVNRPVRSDETTGHGQALADVDQDTAIVAGTLVGHASLHDAVHVGHRRQQVHQLVGQDQRIVARGARRCVASRHFQAVTGTQEHLRVDTRGVDVAARQDTDFAPEDLHVVADVDVAVDQDVTPGGLQLQQPDLGAAQVLLADHALDVDAVGGGHSDRAAGGGVERAARHPRRAVEDEGLHQHGHAALVGAGDDVELVVRGDQRIDDDARPRLHRDVRTSVLRQDRAAEPDVAVAVERDAPVSARLGLRPHAGRTVKSCARVGADRARRRGLDTDAAVVGPGVHADRTRGPQVGPGVGAAHEEAGTSLHLDGRAQARPTQDVLACVQGLVVVAVLACVEQAVRAFSTGVDRAQNQHFLALQHHTAVVGLAVEDSVDADRQVTSGGDGQCLIGLEHHAA